VAIRGRGSDFVDVCQLDGINSRLQTTHEMDPQMPQSRYQVHNTTSYTVFPVLGALGELTMMISCGSIHFAVVDTVGMTVLRLYRPTGPQLPGTMFLTYRLTLCQVASLSFS